MTPPGMASGDCASLEQEGVFSGQGKGLKGRNHDAIPQFPSPAYRSTPGLAPGRERKAKGGGASPPVQAVRSYCQRWRLRVPSLWFSMPLSCPQNLFLQFDTEKSGTLSSYELRSALKATGKAKPGRSSVGCAWPGTVDGPLLLMPYEMAGL